LKNKESRSHTQATTPSRPIGTSRRVAKPLTASLENRNTEQSIMTVTQTVGQSIQDLRRGISPTVIDINFML
jgi:hypothetical protein